MNDKDYKEKYEESEWGFVKLIIIHIPSDTGITKIMEKSDYDKLDKDSFYLDMKNELNSRISKSLLSEGEKNEQ